MKQVQRSRDAAHATRAFARAARALRGSCQGDRIAVEDPGHAVTFDLLAAMDFSLVPVRDALAAHGITATGHSGPTSGIPDADEDRIASGLASAGWMVGPGRRFRIAAGPGVRVSFATLEPADAMRFAADLGRSFREHATRVD
jgi:DNA-binding transcriptional MocR family regulator